MLTTELSNTRAHQDAEHDISALSETLSLAFTELVWKLQAAPKKKTIALPVSLTLNGQKESLFFILQVQYVDNRYSDADPALWYRISLARQPSVEPVYTRPTDGEIAYKNIVFQRRGDITELLPDVYVAPEYRRNGLGQALLSLPLRHIVETTLARFPGYCRGALFLSFRDLSEQHWSTRHVQAHPEIYPEIPAHIRAQLHTKQHERILLPY